MPLMSIDQFDQLPDALNVQKFTLEFGQLPGNADGNELTLRCNQAVWPGKTINPIETKIQGHTLMFRGDKTWSHQLAVSYFETRKMEAFSALETWQNAVVDTHSGASAGPKAQHVVRRAYLNMYNESNELAGQAVIRNVWPQDLPDVQLDANAAQQFLMIATLAYDWVEYSSIPGLRANIGGIISPILTNG